MTESIENILQQFESISLSQMDEVKLMDRVDTKFTFSRTHLPEILAQLQSKYRILEIENKRYTRYQTLYYDTKNLDLYFRHHSGHLSRYKVRHRTYRDSNLGFLEVKYKNNKGRTIKNRIKKNEVPQTWEGETERFIQNRTPFVPATLVPTVWTNFSRITLVDKKLSERLTLDLGLEFVHDGTTKKMENLVIAEVKQSSHAQSDFTQVMKQLHIRAGSISKYCMAIAMSFAKIKQNNFKPRLMLIHKILKNDTITSSKR